MGFLLAKLLPLAFYPLGLALALQLAGLLGRRRPWATGVSVAGIAVLGLAAMPLVSRELVWGLEERAMALSPAVMPTADAVVVLGGGLRPALPPRRGVEVGEAGDRLLTGVELIRRGRAPWLLLSGGRVTLAADDPSPPEARSAAQLAVWLGVPQRQLLLSERARTTAEEAVALNTLARQRRWQRVLLVTSATHMPRALATFHHLTALEVVPVACDYQLPLRRAFGRPTAAALALALLPSADALQSTTVALKEHLGLMVYRWRGWS